MGSDDLHHFKRRKRLERTGRKTREYKDSILIICEGTETEVRYFQGFPIANIKVTTTGVARSNIALVEDAVRIWKEYADKDEYYERVWCVFDRDDFPLKNYNQAFEKVVIEQNKLNKKYRKKVEREVKIDIAYSNQAFELWYLLHFDYISTALDRSDYRKMLTQRIGREYKKNDSGMYSFLERLAQETNNCQGQMFAIQNAGKLRKTIKDELKHNHNPSTTVDLLVVELNKYLKQ